MTPSKSDPKQPRPKKYDKTYPVPMTSEMYANLKRVAGDQRTIAEVIRAAIRADLDRREELSGSGRYFTSKLRKEVDTLKDMTGWQFAFLAVLISEIGSLLITRLVPLSDEEQKQYSPGMLLRKTRERVIEDGYLIHRALKTLPDDAYQPTAESPRRKAGTAE